MIDMKESTQECRKGCDVYEDWEKAAADNVDLILENQRLKKALEWIKEYQACEFLCDDCDTPMLCSKKVAEQALAFTCSVKKEDP